MSSVLVAKSPPEGAGFKNFILCVFVHSGQKCGKLWRNKKHQNVVNFQCARNNCISTWKVISDLGKIEKKILNKGAPLIPRTRKYRIQGCCSSTKKTSKPGLLENIFGVRCEWMFGEWVVQDVCILSGYDKKTSRWRRCYWDSGPA